jgi:hypothetical protein
MFLYGPHLPESILQVLPKEGAGRLPAIIDGTYLRGAEDAAPCRTQAVIQLIVLIADELLVKKADLLQGLPSIRAEIDRIAILLPLRIMEPGASDPKGGAGGHGDGAAKAGPPGRAHEAPHILGIAPLQVFYALSHII